MSEKQAVKGPVERLAMDFRRWGRRATKRVQSMTKRYGVLFDQFMCGGVG